MKGLTLGLAIGLTGCMLQPVLVPANDAPAANGEWAGVRIHLEGDAWNADPRNLPAAMTPLWVAIENQSDRPLQVAYAGIALVGASGHHFPALAPVAGIAPALTRAGLDPGAAQLDYPAPQFKQSGYRIARPYAPLYPGMEEWPFTFPFDPFHFERHHDAWPPGVPNAEVLARAVPEGVIDPPGFVAGFFYFPSVAHERTVHFELKLVDAKSGEPLGTIRIPLNVARR